jgi:tetratricopeptide (TPR) repeat protein
MQLYYAYTQHAPHDPQGFRRLADACLDTKDPKYAPNAFDAATQAVKLDSTNVESRRALARAAAAVRKNEIGLEVYRGIPDSLYDARDYMNVGSLLLGTNREEDRDGARANLETAVSLDSTLADAYFGLGRLDIIDQDWESAEENLLQATKLKPTTPGWVFLNLGVAQLQLGSAPGVSAEAKRAKYDQALASFNKSAELDPKSAQARTYIGQTHALLDRPDEAEKDYKAALDLDPANGGALKGLGFVLITKQRYAEAEQHLVKATETSNASDPGTWVLLGQARAYQAKVTLAQAAFQRALALDPTNKQAKEGIRALEGASGGGAGG